ncbi:MAG: flagellar basal body P-ring protein FlgI [Phycisphaeraceae bacterium]
MHKLKFTSLLALVALLIAVPAGATQIRNVVTLKGSESSVISGIGVVVGLNGTGDGEFGPAHQAVLAAVARNLDATATPQNFTDADSIALVHVSATVPGEGVRQGVDQLDVTVATLNDAKSLKGGVLLDAVLFAPGKNGRAYAVAAGNIMLPDEEENPRRAKVVRGAHMVRDVPSMNLDKFNQITLVLQENKASWQLANFIAEAVNGVMVLADDQDPIARAVDQKNVIIKVPDEALPNLSSFITQIMGTTIDSEIASGGARVIINRAEGTIAMTRDVELSPVIISHKGMTIQIVTPEPQPDPNNPTVENVPFALVDPDNRGGAGLRQLLDALNTLNVPAEDRIAIIKEIHDLGVLHAELIYK